MDTTLIRFVCGGLVILFGAAIYMRRRRSVE
jgi:hypothetical protein